MKCEGFARHKTENKCHENGTAKLSTDCKTLKNFSNTSWIWSLIFRLLSVIRDKNIHWLTLFLSEWLIISISQLIQCHFPGRSRKVESGEWRVESGESGLTGRLTVWQCDCCVFWKYLSNVLGCRLAVQTHITDWHRDHRGPQGPLRPPDCPVM